MPSLKTIGQQQAAAAASASKLQGNFDAVWSTSDPSKVSHDGQGVYSYLGSGGNAENIGSVRTIRPLDPLHKNGMSSFEVTIVETGDHNYISIGVCSESYPADSLPGWKHNSIGYHTDTGSLFIASDHPTPISAPCNKGDVIRCMILTYPSDPTRTMVQFFKNDEKVTQLPIPQPSGGLYGAVGMMGGGEKISLSPPMITRQAEFDHLWEISTPHALEHTGEGVCIYTGAGDFSHDSIGTVRAKHPIDLSSSENQQLFEVRIIEPGEHKYIGIGVVCKTYPPNKLPGWKEISVGYHADNGDLFHSCEEGKPTEYPCMKGDVMRCTVEAIDKGKEVAVLFHRNGEQVGRITSWKPDEGFYFCFGMMSRDEKVQVVLPEISEPYSPEEVALSLEDVWVLNQHLEHRGGGVCHYVGAGGDENVGTMRSKMSLDPFGPSNYFDLKIVDPGEKGFIALGVCSEHYPANRLAGWDDLSVGFHIDDGSIQSSSDQKSTSESCTKGDVVRCAIQPIDKHDKQVNVTFHKNGKFIGKVLFWKPGKGGFFAQVGCMSQGEVIQVASYALSPSYLTYDGQKAAAYEPTFDSQHTAPTVSRTLSTLSARSDSSTSLMSEPGADNVSMMSPLPSLPEAGHPDMPASASLPSMATATSGANPFISPRMPYPYHPGMQPPFFPGHHGNPHDSAHFHHHMYQKWMRWYEMQYFSPHGYHGYPQQGDPPMTSPESGTAREGSTHLTPEPDADTSSPWHFPYPFPPFIDPRATFPPRRGRGTMGGAYSSSTMGPEASHQMSRLYDYAKQVSTASSASDSPPFGFSRENSSEATVASKGTTSQETTHNQSSPGRPSSTSSVANAQGSFNEATVSATQNKTSPLTRYVSQTSNTSSVSSGSQHVSEDQEASTSEPSRVAAAAPGAEPSNALNVRSKLEPRKLLQKEHPFDEKSEQYVLNVSSGTSVSAVSGESAISTQVDKVGQSEPDGMNSSQLTPVVSLDDHTHTPEPVSMEDSSISTSSTTTNVTLTSPATELPTNSQQSKSGESEREDTFPGVLEGMRSDFCRQQQESVDLIPKEENKMYQLLHKVDANDDGSFVRTISDDDQKTGNSFIMCRLPLSEKIPYFEVEVQQIAHSSQQATLAIGLVWENYPVFHLPGSLPGSIALHSNGYISSGGCRCGESSCTAVTGALVDGDIVGCQAQLCYKSEVSHHQAGKKEGNLVKVEFFKNGLLLAVQDVLLPPNGLHPAVGLTGHGTCVKINQNIQLSPKTYFQTHTLPKNFVNFTPPTAESKGWRCLKNATVSEGKKLTINEPHSGLPAVVQHSLPFSMKNFYFEAKLECHVSAFSVLSIGALPQKSASELSTFIPGEAASSVGFLPLIGFVMREGVICSAIPETITSSLYNKSATIGVGIDFRKELSNLDVSASSSDTEPSEDRVLVFFTINGQLINSMFANLPKGGFYPTLAVDSDNGPSHALTTTDLSVAIHFPKLWPKVDNLPYGFVRGAENGFVLQDANSVLDAMGTGCSDVSSLPVRALQAAVPLSPSNSYFEIRILKGGGTYCISIGLASYAYDLTNHPGWRSDSVAFHADDGNLFIDSNPQLVAPPCQFIGTILGCGARFPEDGNTRFAEIYFTVNRHLIARKFVKVPHLGFFPTIGMRTKRGIVTIDLNAPDPYPELKFSTVWGCTENMKIEGNILSQAPNLQRVKRAAAQLSLPLTKEKLVYFKVIALTEIQGTVMLGITTTKQCPQSFCGSQPHKSCILNLGVGKVMIYDKYFQSKESCVMKNSKEFGCGLEPLSSGKEFHLFFTCDDQVVFSSTVEVEGCEVYPIILMMESTTQLKFDACATWPNMTPIGPGWARFANLKVQNSVLSHSPPSTQQCLKKKIPVGFTQTSMPLTPTNPYFEIEVISRASNKAIAIGLASRRYPTNSYVGWHDESIGYHLDDGKLFKAFKHGHSFGPKVFAGNSELVPCRTDTIGCGIRFDKVTHAAALRGGDNLEVFFTINGAILGTQKFVIPCGGAFPTICLESPSESVIFHHHSEIFPPVSKLVDPRMWGNAYSVCQVDRQIKHLCRHKELSGGLPKAFCQAKEPFSPYYPYFEIEIVGLEPSSIIQIGPSIHIPVGCTSPNTHSMLYSTAGQLIMRKNDQKYTLGMQKSGLGDKIGCAVVYEEGLPVAVEFYVNKMLIKKAHGHLLNNPLRTNVLYPTVILTHPGDAVIPTFHIPKPVSEIPFLVGWLRMERVKVKSAIVEYVAAGKTLVDVGVAQASHALNFNTITYYEIEILNPGQKCTISIGAAASDYSLNNQPGWRENSVAMHGDDGRLFQNSGTGTAFGSSWKKYDVVGLGIRSKTNSCMPYSKVQVYFTQNGEEIGHTTQIVPPSGLFPTIGMHSPGEKVKVHIGTQEATPNNYDQIRLKWQALCGVDLKKSPSGAHILRFKDYGRSRPKNLEQGIILSIAIGHQPFSEEMHYFEMEILSKGRLGIAIGVVPTDFPLVEAPGWSHGSVAYHTDDGGLYNSNMKGKDFGPIPHVGDVIGCGVELMPNNTKFCFVFFTYNGFEIGRVRATLPEKGFHPGLALTSKKDKIAVRFMETFKPKLPHLDVSFIGVMRINNCSYSHQIVQFSGTGNSGFSQAPAMAQFAVPMHNDRRYFAANIVRSKDIILIGLAIKDYPMKYALGATSISVAYDTFRGNIKAVYGPDNFMHLEAPVCRVGDTVGCGISLNETESKDEAPGCVFFTRNGTLVKTVTLVELMEDLYPVVGFIPEEKSSAVFMNWNMPLFEPLNTF